MNILHIYGQQFWHDDAFIIGTKEALIDLRCTINRAIELNKPQFSETSTFDGEGYKVLITCLEPRSEWEQLVLPYTDADAVGLTKGIDPAKFTYRRIRDETKET